MNLLDQLTNFCQPPLTINLLQFSNNEPTAVQRPIRHHSVMTGQRNHADRQTKSIEKLQVWAPSNKQQIKQRILIKFARVLSNKVRKYHYNFWVNFECAASNSKAKSKADSVQAGLQALSNFISAYTTKCTQGTDLTLSFSHIKKFSNFKAVQTSLTNAIKPAIQRMQSFAFQQFNQREKNQIRLDVFCNFIDLNVIKKIKSQFFLLVRYMKRNQPIEAPSPVKRYDQTFQLSKKITIKASAFKNMPIYNTKQDYMIKANVEEYQESAKPFFKLTADLCIQNQPQICDNNLIFIERPSQKRKITTAQRTDKQNKNICNDLLNLKTKRLHTKQQHFEPKMKSQNSFVEDSTKKNQTQLITPRHRNITSYSPFNIDETRIQKLERKLFGVGETTKKQNRFSVNGEDWKSDKKALMEIMCNIKSPQKAKRHSAYQINDENILNIKLQNSFRKQVNLNKQNIKTQLSIKKQNSADKGIILKSLFNSDVKQIRQKYESKILVSLKLKKKQSSQIVNSSKSKISRKLSQQQISLKKSQVSLKQLLI